MKSDPSPANDSIVLQAINSELNNHHGDGHRPSLSPPPPSALTGNGHASHLSPNNFVKQNGHSPGGPVGTEVPKGKSKQSEKVKALLKPPDGGYGWVVVIASFMCNVIVDGIIFSFGILLPEISSEFNENKATTAWIGSLQTGFYLIVGPVVSALAERYGCRKMTLIGCALTSLGFILSYFATNVLTLYFTFGLVGGIGFGFVFLPAIVTVGYYFESKRAFATGIAVCGSGVGTFILPPVIQYIIKEFGWRICILFMAGITLFCALFGSLFKPLTIEIDRAELEKKEAEAAAAKALLQEKPLLMRIKEARAAQWAASEENLHVEENAAAPVVPVNGNGPPPYSDVLTIVPLDDPTGNSEPVSKMSGSKSSLSVKASDPLAPAPRKRTRSERRMTLNEMMYSNLSLVVLPQGRSLSNLNQPESKADGAQTTAVSDAAGKTPTDKLDFTQMTIMENKSIFSGFNLALLKRPSFLLLVVSGFLCLVGFFIPFIYISDRAKLLGCSPERCAIILSVIGITNTIGRVFCGWVSDGRVSALMLNNTALTIGGLATILSPILCNNYWTLIVYASVFGFSVATFATLRSVITVQLLGLEKLTSAFGLLLLFQGLAVTIGSPIAGWFFDITGSYDYSFYLAGSAIALSGIMCYPLNAISRWEQRIFNEAKDNDTDSLA